MVSHRIRRVLGALAAPTALTALTALIVLAAFAPARPEIVEFVANLDGDQEVPPVRTPARGYARMILDTQTGKLCLTLRVAGLTGVQSAAHIHGPAPAGANAGVLEPLPVGNVSEECIVVSPETAKALRDGLTYLNVHSSAYPSGEIRGQILPRRREAVLDIKPGSCRNPVNPRFSGSLVVALLATPIVLPDDVDLESVRLAGKVKPLGFTRTDVGSPGGRGEACHCHPFRDGVADLMMKFDQAEVTEALGLSTLPGGAVVEVELTGKFRKGTPFRASDCIRVVRRRANVDEVSGGSPDAAGTGTLGLESAIFRSGGAEIRYAIGQSGPVELSVHDVTGRLVTRLVDATRAAGSHTVSWAEVPPSGIYFVRLRGNGTEDTRKIVHVR